MATTEQLQTQQECLQDLDKQVNHLIRIQVRLETMIREHELRFVGAVSRLHEKYIDEATKLKNTKTRKELVVLGKWNFVKDWIGERTAQDTTLEQLLVRMNKQPERYKLVIPEDEEFTITEYDSLDIRDLKVKRSNETYAQEQKKAGKEYQGDIEFMKRKKLNLENQVKAVEKKIADVQLLIKSKSKPIESKLDESKTIESKPIDSKA